MSDGFDAQIGSLHAGAETWRGWRERVGRAAAQLAGESSGGFTDDVAAAARSFLDSWAGLNDDLATGLDTLSTGLTTGADRCVFDDGLASSWLKPGPQP